MDTDGCILRGDHSTKCDGEPAVATLPTDPEMYGHYHSCLTYGLVRAVKFIEVEECEAADVTADIAKKVDKNTVPSCTDIRPVDGMEKASLIALHD